MSVKAEFCQGCDSWLSLWRVEASMIGLDSIRRNDSIFVCFWIKFLNPDFSYTLVFLEDCSVLSLSSTYFKKNS